MDTIKLRAYAKINLGLDVVHRREDGYHEVRMIMQTISLHDRLNIRACKKDDISIKTNLSYLPTNENNLVYKAALLLKEEFGIREGVSIHLDKHIPVAAGMAGGSTDAAAALVGLNQLFQLGLTKEELMERAVRLGADVPYCILGGTALSEGIGEVLTPLPKLPECFVLIAKPPMHVSTKFVYENLSLDTLPSHPDIDGMTEAIQTGQLEGVISRMENVLESVTIPEYPVIGQLKDIMKNAGAKNALMSGSGPTVFGIFTEEAAANNALKLCRKQNPSNVVFLATVV
ncbi:4-(cytidine 5'-diphospho)-2-C-methyl-D-erythritol kinase [Acetivibrio ethanolgignens]|uniref:4-diphosphocytidyl-2-C-methyl-D-erythritol kinase n=1 Tax=Acetivibrio ethanolgignens TaxID=290052 RepID=A0A0V8QGK0_9FIRM|nr:4-(cytidine 5'-diphospho)-2-C-methyl-D-erythritol kinase [Acetivibrio ethanolgignens]KSV59736.1 4-diphosphocytidyl-2C-methyl-D-erythritol kinase [Acetivibrio ethanolgignens]